MKTITRNINIGMLSITLVAVGFVLGSIAQEKQGAITRTMIAEAERIIGLRFSENQRDSLLDEVNANLAAYTEVRTATLPNSIPPAFVFNPIPPGFVLPTKGNFQTSSVSAALPENREDRAFYSIGELAALIKARKITSLELTTLYLNRLKQYGNSLLCTVTLTEERALEEARRADAEIAKGKYRGLLHGIPYGLKDLFSTKTYKTTWGSALYKDQVLDEDATVVKKLSEAGAVLVAKLSLGEFAMGDVWYGGMTRSPWNLKDGSSGSSAGSAAATAAGLVAFAIGTETYGSIVSPSTRCGVTGLRPTFGRVSRTGAMALAWTFDKVGPICRSVEDCAIVFNAIKGKDGLDASVYEAAFSYSPKVDLSKLRIGYVKDLFENDRGYTTSDSAALTTLRQLGAELIPITLPKKYPVGSLDYLISVEAAAAFDELTRSGKDSAFVQQHKFAWGNQFRAARFIPAVEYVQAQRIRSLVIEEMAALMKTVDVYICPTTEGNNTLLTNLTGHPCVVVPNGTRTDGRPISITFCGRLFDEGTVLTVAKKFQDATGFHKKRPPLAP
ncbi:MAG: amidase [Candidatus Kapabacteria bacterium]|jgi:Asp-tRNA(Asn)/Glu-tRNA(Gln) amidotransferase A subunit family amidase|nr:amidase [Candidatus Kapabacteria bacterium]